MNNNFKMLKLSEEELLSNTEKHEYYKQLREFLLNRKLTNTTPGATTLAPHLKKITNKICNITSKALSCKDLVVDCKGIENIPDCAVIFGQSHQGILDNFIWIPQMPKHCLILHHKDVNPLLLLCQYNTGLILVSKNSKENSANAKLDVMELVLKGFNVSWFPEGTYCLSPNKFHLPMKYGIIDASRKTGAPIVPVVHDYTYESINGKTVITKVMSRYGKPIYVKETDNINDKLLEFQEAISTLKYEIMEENGIYKREDITNNDYIDYVKEIQRNIEISKVDSKKEQEHIYTAEDDFYKFHHLNGVPFDDFGEFIEPEEVVKLKKINIEHNI